MQSTNDAGSTYFNAFIENVPTVFFDGFGVVNHSQDKIIGYSNGAICCHTFHSGGLGAGNSVIKVGPPTL